MAIEREAGMGGKGGPMMDESPAGDYGGGMPEGGDSETETTSIPISMLGGQKVNPGDVVRLEVVEVNEDEGTFIAKYATPKKPSGGINTMAAAFDKAKPASPQSESEMV